MKDIYLVIGGSGFVGRHIVQQLLERGDTVSVFDIVQRYHDTPFYPGDISEKDQVAAALRKSGTTCIIHTASPIAVHGNAAIFWKVNVNGTEAVIAAAVECGVKKLVYTSSAGVVFNGGDIVNVDERLPPPEQSLDAYNESKAKAEKLVLEANGKGGLLTVALRPAGIFGPGDRQAMIGLYKVYEEGKTHFQIGDNDNLFDWTCVENVAYAHLLAADKLNTPPPAPPIDVEKYVAEFDYPEPTEQEDAIVNSPLRNVDVTTGRYRIPTSEARPLGPYVDFPKNGEKIQAAFDSGSAETPLPISRARFDPLSDHALSREKLNHPEVSPLQVAGQVFFITNGEPIYFWDLPRTVWRHLDAHFPEQAKARQRGTFKLSKSIGLLAATGAEWYGWLVGKEPAFTRYKVTYSCVNRWHNIEKARRVLGYEPKVSLQDGIKNMVDHWWADYKASGKAQ